ncbi:MAG: GTPase HflX [Spirochaetes bacterium]|nr:GTPase HflX [Spirochaetota bacterium]
MYSKVEQAFIVNFYYNQDELYLAEDDLKECEMLAMTAGVQIIMKENIHLRNIDSAYFITRGKLEIIKYKVKDHKINVLIVNKELKPVQVRNLEEYLKVKVIGRTELILDIFAQHARTSEAKIQVELAQLRYLLPRLTGYGILLSRLGGGIGTRGPGETKLEYDRRHILRRISTLQKKLKDIEKHHQVISKNRTMKVVTLVGYTNAGKTTLFNALTHENLKTGNSLFVTLDPTIRKVSLDNEQNFILLSDTVGFIKELPHSLVASFKATLSEVKNSDLVLHVIDIQDRNIEAKIKTVEEVIAELGLEVRHSVIVFNKIDKMKDQGKITRFTNLYPESVFVSAREKINIDNLKKIILIKAGKNNGL